MTDSTKNNNNYSTWIDYNTWIEYALILLVILQILLLLYQLTQNNEILTSIQNIINILEQINNNIFRVITIHLIDMETNRKYDYSLTLYNFWDLIQSTFEEGEDYTTGPTADKHLEWRSHINKYFYTRFQFDTHQISNVDSMKIIGITINRNLEGLVLLEYQPNPNQLYDNLININASIIKQDIVYLYPENNSSEDEDDKTTYWANTPCNTIAVSLCYFKEPSLVVYRNVSGLFRNKVKEYILSLDYLFDSIDLLSEEIYTISPHTLSLRLKYKVNIDRSILGEIVAWFGDTDEIELEIYADLLMLKTRPYVDEKFVSFRMFTSTNHQISLGDSNLSSILFEMGEIISEDIENIVNGPYKINSNSGFPPVALGYNLHSIKNLRRLNNLPEILNPPPHYYTDFYFDIYGNIVIIN